MPNFQLEKIVNINREKLFRIVTDFENFSKVLPEYFKDLQILKSEGNVHYIQEKIKFLGKKLDVKTKHIVNEPNIHEIHILSGPAKGSKFIENFQIIPEGTKITIDVNFKLNGILSIFSFLMKNKIKKDMLKTFDEFLVAAKNYSFLD